MSEPENFLSRWSRRKQDVAREEGAAKLDTDAEVTGREDGSAGEASPQTDEPKKTGAAAPEEPAFDLSKLPSIESITAETDIRPFLAAGVPLALRNAALRRVWVADPKIRDFIEMAENQWDFTGAAEVPGFDFSAPVGDVRRLVADMLGQKPTADESPAANEASNRSVETARDESPSGSGASSHPNVIESRSTEVVSVRLTGTGDVTEQELAEDTIAPQKNRGSIASQNNDAPQNEREKISRRSHGGALPK